MIYKFNQDSKTELDDLKNCKAYILYHKLLNEYTNDEKLWITREINTNSYYKYAIPLKGWCFNFIDKLKKFWVKFDFNSICEFYAIDKDSLVKFLNDSYGEKALKILEIKE